MVNPNATKPYAYKADVFPTKSYKTLFPFNRARPDIQTTVPFLCTIVKGTEEYD